MADHAAIQGTFADLKSVKTRSVVQMVIEIPIERAEQVIKAFGFPQPGAEIAVAVARLDPEKAKASPAPLETPAKPKKRFHELPMPQQAAQRCNDAGFQLWLEQTSRTTTAHPNNAADYVRWFCDVKSRADIGDNMAGVKWDALNADYESRAGHTAEMR